MRRTRFQTLLTSLLLTAFLADATNALALYAPHRIALHEVGAHLETNAALAHDECVKQPPLKHLIKFTDIDSPLLQAAHDSDGFCETLTYTVSNDARSVAAPLSLVSLHKLCMLLI